jgi:glycerate kinase
VLGLGGSATNDAGTGILDALGFDFLDVANRSLEPCGANLALIRKIITPAVMAPIEFQIAADVQNPLFGPQGAAFIYAPQKGAGAGEVEKLDQGLQNLAGLLQQVTGVDVALVPGAGAAGGIAAGLMAFFKTEIVSGVGKILEIAGLEQALSGASLVITGEGRLDNQSFSGKVVGSIAALAGRNSIPCVAICGQSGLDQQQVAAMGLEKVVSLMDGSVTEKEAVGNAFALIEEKAGGLLP